MFLVHTAIGRNLLASAAALSLLGCGGAGGNFAASEPPSSGNGHLAVVLTDTPSDRWAGIGLIVRSIAIVPKGAFVTNAIQIYDGSQDTVPTNLIDLDGVGALLSKATLPMDYYDRVQIKVDFNPANVLLTPSLDPSGLPQNPLSSSQITLVGPRDITNGTTILPTITLLQDLQIIAGVTSSLQLDFDLTHPLFVESHDESLPAAYAISCQVRSKPRVSVLDLNLEDIQGNVIGVADKFLAVHTSHSEDIPINLDYTHGTTFFDLDGGTQTNTTTMPPAMTVGKYAKVQFRFQSDATMGAVRVWLSSDPTKLTSRFAEGHIVKWQGQTARPWDHFYLLNDQGKNVQYFVDEATQFFLNGSRTPIGIGKACLSWLYPDFKVQVTLVDPTAVQPVAKEINIQHALVDGTLTAITASGFAYLNHKYDVGASPNPVLLPYDTSFTWATFNTPAAISSDVPTFLTHATATGTNPQAAGFSELGWDSGSAKWVATDTVFIPSQLSAKSQLVATGYAGDSMTISYDSTNWDQTTVPTSLRVKLSSGAGTQVTRFTRRAPGSNPNGDPELTVSTIDSADWSTELAAGAKVRVYGLPNADGSLNAYFVNTFK